MDEYEELAKVIQELKRVALDHNISIVKPEQYKPEHRSYVLSSLNVDEFIFIDGIYLL